MFQLHEIALSPQADCNHLLMSRAWRLITVAAVVAAEGARKRKHSATSAALAWNSVCVFWVLSVAGGLGEEAALEFVETRLRAAAPPRFTHLRSEDSVNRKLLRQSCAALVLFSLPSRSPSLSLHLLSPRLPSLAPVLPI